VNSKVRTTRHVCIDPARQCARLQHHSRLHGGRTNVRRRVLHLPARIGQTFCSLLSSPGWAYTLCPGKRDPKYFLAISSTKVRRFWWNLVDSFTSKFAAKLYKCFSLHVNSVSVPPCETKNAHENSKIYPLLTVAPKFARFESSWLRRVGNTARSVQNMHHWTGPIDDGTDERLPQ